MFDFGVLPFRVGWCGYHVQRSIFDVIARPRPFLILSVIDVAMPDSYLTCRPTCKHPETSLLKSPV